ncbi:hypothetical protein OOK36_34285 [Streptomyces sp. NBC_00365]|uniref:hypothetical protein n=1 Tax=Streptomyces sp. NBC_00365 TaxID=2975726 RepID=UPI002254989D|nr:hypothetical protein [Streptomyces sp. NBC_00365]MCX5093865.1 hypothetical protein [Streptomyces sp. NBC_00365]
MSMSAPSFGGPHSRLTVLRGTITESGTQAPLPQLGFCHLEGSGGGGRDLDLAAYASTGGGDGTDLPFLAEPHGPQHADVLDVVETFDLLVITQKAFGTGPQSDRARDHRRHRNTRLSPSAASCCVSTSCLSLLKNHR